MSLSDEILVGARLQKSKVSSGSSINISVSPALKEAIQAEAAKRGLNTSGLVKLALSAFLKADAPAGDADLPE